MVENRIHRWDNASVLKGLVISAISETIAIAPAILSPWDHAGPETTLGWLSVLFNLPGIFLVGLFHAFSDDEPMVIMVAAVFTIQTIMLSYFVFVLVRWRKVRLARGL